MRVSRDETPLAPVLRELSRLSESIRAEHTCDCRETIAELRQEIAELRATVAHLRAGRTDVPSSLRPVVARSVVDQQVERRDA